MHPEYVSRIIDTVEHQLLELSLTKILIITVSIIKFTIQPITAKHKNALTLQNHFSLKIWDSSGSQCFI